MAAGDRIFMAKESTSQEILSNTKKIIEDGKSVLPSWVAEPDWDSQI